EIGPHEEHFILPIWSAYSTIVKNSRDKIEKNTDFKTCEKPVSQVEQIFLEELEKLKRQENTPLSVAGPSRVLNDSEPLYLGDPSMLHLKDIYASPSEGIFTDSSYDDEGVVKQKEDGIFISQDKYVAKILKKFDFHSVKTARTPIETQKPLVKDKKAADISGYSKDFTPSSCEENL
nr:uncharacterized mitochondrial protein AtMg00810-like [Tanacetum cinerariifolium]